MERKRKLPPRAAARVEQSSKKQNTASREKSETPAPTPQPAEEPPPPPPPLPSSIQTGKPLPTTEEAQPDDLSLAEYQSVTESGVLVESLARSRHKWLSEGLFEKYWTKPHKRKGVLVEEPNNPPKDSMTKVGTVTITIEPHIIEATMYTVKDPKPKPQIPAQPQQQPYTQSQLQPKPPAQAQSQPTPARPIIQYGPPNGMMPPPAAPAPSPVANSRPATSSSAPAAAQPSPRPALASPAPSVKVSAQPPQTAPGHPPAVGSPGLQPKLVSGSVPGQPVAASPLQRPQGTPPTGAAPPTAVPQSKAGSSTWTQPAPSSTPTSGSAKPPTPGPVAAKPAAKPAANDPVIALLAKKASGDPNLRDLMKRVAMGQAREGELQHFQRIIDQLNAEYKRSGGQQGPSADRLMVDSRTVKYFADEVRTILDIVLASNPQQKSAGLRPPPGSDPLVVLLVKNALDSPAIKDMIKRIAENTPGFTDAQDLKDLLDRLNRELKAAPKPSPVTNQAKPPPTNGLHNGHQANALGKPTSATPGATHPAANAQSLRSKGPPPAPKPDIASVVFDFGGGDRYLFPKFSILEFLPTSSGQQVLASFLIVRKGSTSEYGSDPELDFYQPVTIRLSTATGRSLDNLRRVVAPLEEVRRYMDDVMDNMTRAEYVLLAMRLPRAVKDGDKEELAEEPKAHTPAPKTTEEITQKSKSKPGVLWMSSADRDAEPTIRAEAGGKRFGTGEDDAQEREWSDMIRAATKRNQGVA
jgi:hypothetical protein